MNTSKASLIRSHVVRALLNKQQVGGDPKFMEDVYANVKPGRTSYCDLIDGLAHLATELEMTPKEVRNALTSSCFRKDFHDKTNPSNPFPFNDIFREDVDIYDDTEPIARDDGTLGEQVGVDGLEETDIDQGKIVKFSSEYSICQQLLTFCFHVHIMLYIQKFHFLRHLWLVWVSVAWDSATASQALLLLGHLWLVWISAEWNSATASRALLPWFVPPSSLHPLGQVAASLRRGTTLAHIVPARLG